jgi:hypothetical protein
LPGRQFLYLFLLLFRLILLSFTFIGFKYLITYCSCLLRKVATLQADIVESKDYCCWNHIAFIFEHSIFTNIPENHIAYTPSSWQESIFSMKTEAWDSSSVLISIYHFTHFTTQNIRSFNKKPRHGPYIKCKCINSRGSGRGAGWDTALQAGRSLVRFPVGSSRFHIDVILQVALWTWIRVSLWQKWVPAISFQV